MRSLRRHLRRRRLVLAIVGLTSLGWHTARTRPGEHTEAGIAEMLGRATGAGVDAEHLFWEPSKGVLADLWKGRALLFVGTPPHQEVRDVYRAWIRLAPSGRPLSVVATRNLTETPLGDDAGLILRGSHAAYATAAFGRVHSVSLLDLRGISRAHLPQGALSRLRARITALQEQGSADGIGRVDLVLRLPARGVRLRLGDASLSVAPSGTEQPFTYELETGRLRLPDALRSPPLAKAVPQMYGGKPSLLWAVDTVRAEVGPEPIAWLEQKVFATRDVLRRTAYTLFGSGRDAAGVADLSRRGLPTGDAPQVQDGEPSWPPARIPSLWRTSEPGEGGWRAVEHSFLAKPPSHPGAPDPPPYFFETYIRPDPRRPYSKLWLIAMDMRQLELGMQAGYEDPKPLTGPPGDGRLPDDPRLQSRVVATFNGAFKTTHGEYGMMVDRRVLLPPAEGAATVIITQDQRTGVGTWPRTKAIPDDVLSFRQNLDPLVADGVANPSGRRVWGWQIAGESVLTQRTALCATPGGHLVYAWGEEIDGPTLARGLRQAGCAYAMHLDMNPGHCAFVYTRVINPVREEYKLKLAKAAMQSNPARYVRWSTKDFFYAALREPFPPTPRGMRWQLDGGTQPPPAWLPGIFRATKKVASLEIELLAVDRGRVDWRLVAGRREPTLLNAAPMQVELPAHEASRVLGAISLGHTTGATRYGIAFQGLESLPLREDSATLLVTRDESPRLLRTTEAFELQSNSDVVQLPWLAEGGQMLPSAREHGARRLRGALCVTPNERILVARTVHDTSAPLVTLLLEAGCSEVVELDRGSHHPALLHRAGMGEPPKLSYGPTVLYLLARHPEPRAFVWKPEAPSGDG